MRNLNLFFTFALSLAASASAHAEALKPGLVARQTNTGATQTQTQTQAQTTQATQATKTSQSIINQNPTPTGGVGDAVQGDVDTTLSTSTPTQNPITTTDKNGKTITEMPSKTSTSKKIKISADAQPGGVQMMTPSVMDGYQIYKIGDPVTFVWNFTSLQVTPTALNVQAYCTDGAQYFPIAMNVSAGTTEVVWDTGAYQNTALSKLPMATYTLVIYDEARGATAFPSPGYLYPFSGLTFGMYPPQPATPLASFQCATCDPSSASLIDTKALRFLLAMGLLTALSFMWFVGGVL